MRESPPSGSARRSTVAARSSSHGRRGAGMPVEDAAAMRLRTSRFWSFGPRSPSCSSDSGPASASHTHGGAEPELGDLRLRATRARRSSSLRRSPTGRAPAGPVRSSRCRGRGATGRTSPATGSPTTSLESATSAIRSATRRLVLARRLSLMTPAGRCVAMIRWMPSERPRWAMSTTPSTNSGTSPARAANSSMTSTSAGGVSGSCRFSSSSRSFAFLRLNRCSRWCSSARRLVSARRTRCGLRSVTRPTQCGRSTQSANADPPL